MKCRCSRCGNEKSLFWYNIEIAGRSFDLCDSCMMGLIRYLEAQR